MVRRRHLLRDHPVTNVGLIGCGGIAGDVVAALRAGPANGVSIAGASRPRRRGAGAAW
jgi:hypothetical protein